jgi:ribose transport system permease protein
MTKAQLTSPYRAALKRVRRSGIVIPFAVLFVVLSFASGTFATKVNLVNLLDQQSSVLIIACAGTLVFVAGGLDLSVGAVYALSAVVSAQLAQHGNILVALIVGLLMGMLVGLVNGIIVAALEINALITTLAMSFVVSGIAALMTSGNSITLYSRPSYGDLAQTTILTVPSSVWVLAAVACVLGVLLWATAFGRYVYAVGGNANAARLAGLRVTRIRIATFTISGGAAALGGLIDSSRVLSAQASNGGQALTFTVIAGIVVGGTSILGGEGAIWRSILGVLLLALIGNGYNLLGLDPLYQQVTLGVLILVSVGLEGLSRLTQRWNFTLPGRGRAALDPASWPTKP